MTVFGDLELSTLRELPAGRAPIATTVVPGDKPGWIGRMWQRIAEEVFDGRQAYVVCPAIGGEAGPSSDGDETELWDADEAPATRHRVVETAQMLGDGPLRGLRIGVLHGRLPGDGKDRVMQDFAEGRLDVLVATTVVEVGVDVPNATVMAVLDADRFGVSQLHQLRGRVGRGSHEGLCLLVTEAEADSKSRQRLDTVAGTLDGFKLSRLDLEQRREGDVLGAAQAGRRSSLKLLTLLKDEELIGRARREATELVSADPALAGYPALASALRVLLDQERAEYLEKA
jgi:ATP-dependent DNA helicase RecG